jgi:hypothetical protein
MIFNGCRGFFLTEWLLTSLMMALLCQAAQMAEAGLEISTGMEATAKEEEPSVEVRSVGEAEVVLEEETTFSHGPTSMKRGLGKVLPFSR